MSEGETRRRRNGVGLVGFGKKKVRRREATLVRIFSGEVSGHFHDKTHLAVAASAKQKKKKKKKEGKERTR